MKLPQLGPPQPRTLMGRPYPTPPYTNSRDELCVPVLYLDLDGTVRHGKDELGHFVNNPSDVHIFPEALTMMHYWKGAGGRIIAVSNQGGIALGHVTSDQIIRTMVRTHAQAPMLDKIAWCQHHPDATDPEYARCWCRKPAPGLLIEASLSLASLTGEIYPPHMALFVGDRDEDQECARICSIDFIWAKEWRAAGGAN